MRFEEDNLLDLYGVYIVMAVLFIALAQITFHGAGHALETARARLHLSMMRCCSCCCLMVYPEWLTNDDSLSYGMMVSEVFFAE